MAKGIDDFDLDDLDDLDFGDEPPRGATGKDRNPVLDTIKQAKTSTLNAVVPRGERANLILSGLPKDATVAYQNARELEYVASDVLAHTKEELVKTQRRLKQQTRQLVPTLKKYLPDAIVDPVERWSKPEDFSYSQNYDPQQATLDRGLADVFSGGVPPVNQDTIRKENDQRVENDVQEKLRQTVRDIKTDNLHQMVSGINTEISNISTFTRGINVNFQKKLLELNYRQMFAMQDMLMVTKAAFDRTAPALDAIVKNTALPDYAKESFGEIQGAAFKRTVAEWVSPAKYMDNFVSDFQEKLKGKISGLLNEGGSIFGDLLSMGVEDEVDDFDFEGTGFKGPDSRNDNIKNKGKNVLFSALAKKFINPKRDKLLEWSRGKLEENPQLAEYLSQARYMTGNVGAIASSSAYGDREGVIGDIFKAASELGLYGRLSKESVGLGTRDAGMLSTASKFDNRTYLTLNEVIPAELREIRRAITKSYGMDDDRVYDLTARSFVDEKLIGNRVRKHIGNDDVRAKQRAVVDRIIDKIGKDKFNAAERGRISKFIENIAATGREFNVKEILANPDRLTAQLGYELTQKFVSALEEQSDGGDSAYGLSNMLGEEMSTLRRGYSSYQKRVDEMQSIYGDRALMSSRLFKYDRATDRIVSDDNLHDIYRDIGNVDNDAYIDSKRNDLNERIRQHLTKGSATASYLNRFKDTLGESSSVIGQPKPKQPGTFNGNGFNFPVLSSILFGDHNTNFVELIRKPHEQKTESSSQSSETTKIIEALKGNSVKDEIGKLLAHVKNIDEEGVLIATLSNGKSAERQSSDGKKRKRAKRRHVDLSFDKGLLSRWFGLAGDTLSGGFNAGKSVLGGIKSGSSKIFGKMGLSGDWLKDKTFGIPAFMKDATVAGVRGLGALGKAVVGARDIYDSSGNRILDGARLKEGQYYVKEGDKLRAIYGIEEIVGEIYDKDGNVVISAEKLAQAGSLSFYKDSRWWKLTEVIGGGVGNLINRGVKLPKVMAGSAVEKLKATGKWFISYPDMYVAGESSPRIYSRVLSSGGYRLSKTGKIIRKPSDIDGQVETVDGGNVVISAEEVTRPDFKLVTKWGNEVKTPLGRIVGRGLGGVKLAVNLARKVPAVFAKAYGNVRDSGPVQWGKNKLKNNFISRWWNKEDDGTGGKGWFSNNSFGFGGGSSNKTNEILINIYRLLNRRMPGEPESESWLDEKTSEFGAVKSKAKSFFKKNKRRSEAYSRLRRMHGDKSFGEKLKDRFSSATGEGSMYHNVMDRFNDSSTGRIKDALGKLYGRDDDVAAFIKERLTGNLGAKLKGGTGSLRKSLYNVFDRASEKEADLKRRASVNSRLAKRKAKRKVKSTREMISELLRNSEMSWFNQMRTDAENGDVSGGRFRSMIGKFEKRVKFGQDGEKRDYFRWFKSKKFGKKSATGVDKSDESSLFDKFKPQSAFGKFMYGSVKFLGGTLLKALGMLMKGGAMGAIGLAKMVGKGVLAPLAKGAVSAVTAVGGAVVAAVGWPAIAIGATAAVVGWAAYKAATRKRAYYLDKLRLAQYGIQDYKLWSSDDGAKTKYLEVALEKYATFDGNGNAVLRGLNANEVEEISKGYGLDPEDKTQMLSFHAYVQQRFIPVYLSWLSAIRKAETSPKLEDLGSTSKVSKEDMLIIFNAVKRSADDPIFKAINDPRQANRGMFKRAWDAVTFTDIGYLTGEEVAEVTKEVEKEIRARKEFKRKSTDDKFSVDTVAAGFNNIADVDQGLAKLNGGDKATESGVDGVTGATAKLDQFAVFVEDIPLELKDIDALQSLRFKAYGLTTLNPTDVKKLIAFEDAVLPNINRQNGSYEGDLKAALGKLGISEDHPKYKTARIWFRFRFLPVYATFVIACKRYVPNANPNRLVNSGSYIYEIALLIERAITERGGVKVSIWSVLETPFDTAANTDASSVKQEMETLKKLSKEGDLAVRSLLKANEMTNKPIFLRKKDRSQGMFEVTGDSYSGAPAAIPDSFKPNNQLIGSGSSGASSSAPALNINKETKAGNYATIRDTASDIPSIIKEAAAITGISPSLLLTVAQMESSLNPNAKPPKGSARGLFQFMPETWNELLRKHGNRYGIPSDTPATDPIASSILGAEYLKEGSKVAKSTLGKDPAAADYYMPHFLGPGGAKKFYEGLKKNPSAIAAQALPSAAKYNPRIFYDNQGKPRTFAEVYKAIHQKIASSESYIRKYVGGSETTNVASMFDSIPNQERRSNAIDYRAIKDGSSLAGNTTDMATPLPDGSMPEATPVQKRKSVETATSSFAAEFPTATPEELDQFKAGVEKNIGTENNVVDIRTFIDANRSNTEVLSNVLERSYDVQSEMLNEMRKILQVLLERSENPGFAKELRRLEDLEKTTPPLRNQNVSHGSKQISTARIRNL